MMVIMIINMMSIMRWEIERVRRVCEVLMWSEAFGSPQRQRQRVCQAVCVCVCVSALCVFTSSSPVLLLQFSLPLSSLSPRENPLAGSSSPLSFPRVAPARGRANEKTETQAREGQSGAAFRLCPLRCSLQSNLQCPKRTPLVGEILSALVLFPLANNPHAYLCQCNCFSWRQRCWLLLLAAAAIALCVRLATAAAAHCRGVVCRTNTPGVWRRKAGRRHSFSLC